MYSADNNIPAKSNDNIADNALNNSQVVDHVNTVQADAGGDDAGGDDAAKASAERPHRPIVRALAWVGIVGTLVAWVAFFYSDTVAVVSACVGFAAAVAGCFAGRGCLRDLSITCVVASGVLMIVYALFYWGMDYLIETL